MNEPSRYGLTSPVGIEQGRFRIHRDDSRTSALNGTGNHRLFAGLNTPAGKPAALTERQASLVAKHRKWPGLARGADGHDPRLREQRLMRRHGSAFLFAAAGLIAAGLASAGGPLGVFTNGEPYVWNAATIQYRTDGGPLSATVTEQTARTRVQNMFNVWQNVGSASISYSRAGAILDVGAFTDGDVSTAVEYDAVNGACGSGAQNPDYLRRDRRDLRGRRRRRFSHRLRRSLRDRPCAGSHPQRQRGDERAVPGRPGGANRGSDGRGVRRDLHPRVRALLGSRPFADQRRLRLRELRRRQPRRTADDVPLPRERRAGHALDRRHRLDLEALPRRGGGGFADDPRHDHGHDLSFRTASRTPSS